MKNKEKPLEFHSKTDNESADIIFWGKIRQHKIKRPFEILEFTSS